MIVARESANDLEGCELVVDEPEPDSIGAIRLQLAYLRQSWQSRPATEVNAVLDDLVQRLGEFSDEPIIEFNLEMFRQARDVARAWAEDRRVHSWSGPERRRGHFRLMGAMGPAKELIGYNPDDYPVSSSKHEHLADWVHTVATFICRVARRHYVRLMQRPQT